MYRYKYFKNLPKFFDDYFTQNNEIHHYNTQNANKLHVRYRRTNFTKRTISTRGVITWNILLDNKIANIMSYSVDKYLKILCNIKIHTQTACYRYIDFNIYCYIIFSL